MDFFFGGFSIFALFMMVIPILIPIIALVDIIKSDFEGNNKLLWVIIVLLANILGAILYFLIGRDQKINRSGQ